MPTNQSLRWLFVRLPLDPDAPRRPLAAPLPLPGAAALIGFGGVLGSLARAWVATVVPHQSTAWPWSTFAVNVGGCWALAIVLITLIERYPFKRFPRPLIGTGILGGFTTFSTFALDVVNLSRQGRVSLAALYVAATLVSTLAACVIGIWCARATDRLVDRERWHRRIRAFIEQSSQHP